MQMQMKDRLLRSATCGRYEIHSIRFGGGLNGQTDVATRYRKVRDLF